jgi:hypothetical protein
VIPSTASAHQLSRRAFGVLVFATDAGKRFLVKNAAKCLPFDLRVVLESMACTLMHTLKPAVGAFHINQIDALYLACQAFRRGCRGGGPDSVKYDWPRVMWTLHMSLGDFRYANGFVKTTRFTTAVLVRAKNAGGNLFDGLNTDTFNLGPRPMHGRTRPAGRQPSKP